MSHQRSRSRWWRLGLGLAVAGTTGAATLAASGVPVAAAVTAELPTYQVRATGISEAQAAALGKAFGIERLSRSQDGSVRFADEQGFLDIPSITVGETGKDEDGNPTVGSVLDEAALARLRPIDADKALSLTREALTRAGLYPEQARPTVGHTTLEMVDAKGKQTASAALDTTVSFSFDLGGLPYEGPGAKIRVGFGSDGAVSQLSYSTRVLERGEPVRVLDPDAGRERCAKALQGAVRIQQADYAYAAPALDAKLERIEPSFRCSGVNADGSAAQITFVPAAVDAELPEVTPSPVPPRRSAAALAAPRVQAYGVVDVGSEGTGPCSGLPWTGNNLAVVQRPVHLPRHPGRVQLVECQTPGSGISRTRRRW